jgi:hypothetical protein
MGHRGKLQGMAVSCEKTVAGKFSPAHPRKNFFGFLVVILTFSVMS